MIDTRTRFLLEDMLENARAAQEFSKDRDIEVFGTDLACVYATTRAVEIVCEAAYQVDSKVQDRIPSLPWQDAIAMRHKLVHGYRRIDPKVIYKTVREDFPGLIAELERLLSRETN